MDILNQIVAALTGFGFVILNLLGASSVPAIEHIITNPNQTASSTAAAASSATVPNSSSTASLGPKVYSDAELLAMAGDTYATGNVPLGDHKYVTTGPKKGYIYLCHVNANGTAGSAVNGPWISGTTWNFKEKTHVSGAVSWKGGTFSNIVTGATRLITGNDLPQNHITGVFPIAASDPAYQYDRNPNSIKSQSLKYSLPANPTYSATPTCMGGEVGIMLDGVPLFNGFDEPLRDAPAHELQDSCDGHPQISGEYHYHNLSSCLKDTSVKTVLGYALDGFPITGPVVAAGKYLTTNSLDECHGLTSEIILNGKKVVTYHYVMTYDFPYSASCFRGTPSTTGPSGGAPKTATAQQTSVPPTQAGGTPPAQAVSACAGKTSGASCSFTGGRGETVSGTCETPPGASLACVPTNRP